MSFLPWRRSASPAETRDSLENPSVSLVAAIMGTTDSTLDSTTGASVTPERSMRVVAFMACLKLLAETIASLPINVYTRDENGTRQAVLDDPRRDLLTFEPNPEMTAFVFWSYIVVSVCVWGNGFAYIETDSNGNAAALWPIQLTKVQRAKMKDGSKGWLVDVGTDGRMAIFDDEMMHFRGIGLDTSKGLSNVSEARNALGISMSAEDYAGRMFQNDGHPGAIIQSERAMTDEQFESFRARWRAGHEGLRNSHKFALLPPGLTYSTSGFDPSNLQMIEAREFQIREIARLMRIPPRMIGAVQTSGFADAENEAIDFVAFSLTPWLVNFQQVIRRGLFSSKRDRATGMFVDHETSQLLRAGSVPRARIDNVYRLAGIKTANEIRESIGLPPYPGGDTLWQPVNVQVVDPNGTPLTHGEDFGVDDAAEAAGAGVSDAGGT
jgi:HK97 family phage portal protein